MSRYFSSHSCSANAHRINPCRIKMFLFLLILAFLVSYQAFAQPAAAKLVPSELLKSGDWTAYVLQSAAGKSCYVASLPKSSEPKGLNRDPATFFITHRPGAQVKNEVFVQSGYPFKEASKVSVEVVSAKGKKTFTLFTREQGAWVEQAATESQLVAALRESKEFIVKGTSKRGTNTTDKYSLTGISAALDRIGQECK